MRTIGDLLGKVDLLGLDSSVEVARAYVRSVLYQAGRREVDDIVLLASEVFTNAIRHSQSGHRRGGMVHLRVYEDGETVAGQPFYRRRQAPGDLRRDGHAQPV